MKRKDSAGFKPVLAIGLMSGTSLDGVDAVLLETDGEGHIVLKASAYVKYTVLAREWARDAATGDIPLSDVLRLERELSELYVKAIKALGKKPGVNLKKVAVIGCHGQTIRHLPDEGLTWQLGDPNYIAAQVGIPTVMDFRRRDMAHGGQGAPLVPLFHQALVGKKVACSVLNLGGVANLTCFDGKGGIRASDCGPGMGLMDAWMEHVTGYPYDKNGRLAAEGSSYSGVLFNKLAALMDSLPFSRKPFPKSAHRHEFDPILDMVKEYQGIEVEAGLSALCALTARGIHHAWASLGAPKGPMYVVGGGAKNKTLLWEIEGHPDLAGQVIVGDKAGLRSKTMEAEAFAWLAVRRLRHLPFSVPATTGCKLESTGGTLTA